MLFLPDDSPQIHLILQSDKPHVYPLAALKKFNRGLVLAQQPLMTLEKKVLSKPTKVTTGIWFPTGSSDANWMVGWG